MLELYFHLRRMGVNSPDAWRLARNVYNSQTMDITIGAPS